MSRLRFRGKGQLNGEASPFARLAFDPKRAAEIADALANANQPESVTARIRLVSIRLESSPIVLDRHDERRRQTLDEHAAGPRLRVPRDVRQCFLNRPVRTELEIDGKTLGRSVANQLRSDAGAIGKLPQIPFEGVGKAEVVEHARTKQLRQITDASKGAAGDRPRLGEGRSSAFIRAHGSLRSSDLEIDGRQRLTDLVVEFARNGSALILLRPCQPSGQTLELLLVSEDLRMILLNLSLESTDVPRRKQCHGNAEAHRRGGCRPEAAPHLLVRVSERLLLTLASVRDEVANLVRQAVNRVPLRNDLSTQDGVCRCDWSLGTLCHELHGGVPVVTDFVLEPLPVGGLDSRVDGRSVLPEFTRHVGPQSADLIPRRLRSPFVGINQRVAHIDRSEQHLGSNRKQELLAARKS